MERFRTLATEVNLGPLPHVEANDATMQTILTIVFTTTGAISLLIITIAAFKLIASRGSPQDLTKTKNALVFAVIGLVISVSAGVIISFVIGGIT